MSLFNEILVGRYNSLLTKILGMKERSPAPQLATEISPVFIVNQPDDHLADFTAQIRNTILSMALAAGGAGTFSKALLFNPVGSGVLAEVESIIASLGAADGVTVFLVNSSAGFAGAAGTNRVRDTRWQDNAVGGTISPTTQGFSLTDNTTPGSDIFRADLAANTPLLIPTHHVLSPGWGLYVTSKTAVQTVKAVFFCRERAIEPSETR